MTAPSQNCRRIYWRMGNVEIVSAAGTSAPIRESGAKRRLSFVASYRRLPVALLPIQPLCTTPFEAEKNRRTSAEIFGSQVTFFTDCLRKHELASER